MQEYQAFTEYYLKSLTRVLQESFEAIEVYLQYIQSVNRLREAVCVKYADSPVAPVIYVDEKFAQYQKGMTVEQIVKETTEQLISLRKDTPDLPQLSKETAKANLYCVAINAEKNAALLNASPHEKFFDLAIIPRFRIDEGTSFIVKNEHCSLLEMTNEEILELAWQNTYQNGFTCKSMNDVLREIMVMQGQAEEEIEDYLRVNGSDNPLYVLTNKSRIDGAVALASSAALKDTYDKITTEIPTVQQIFIIPSSRHELVVVPDSRVADVEDLRRVHEAVQVSNVLPEDKLSNQIYKFDGRKCL